MKVRLLMVMGPEMLLGFAVPECSVDLPWGSEDSRRTRLAVSREELICGTEGDALVVGNLGLREDLTERDDGVRIGQGE